jgi:hypothetical protein
LGRAGGDQFSPQFISYYAELGFIKALSFQLFLNRPVFRFFRIDEVNANSVGIQGFGNPVIGQNLSEGFRVTVKTLAVAHIKAEYLPLRVIMKAAKGEPLAVAKPVIRGGVGLNQFSRARTRRAARIPLPGAQARLFRDYARRL